jgi:transcriptional regulator with XRE-family HTH domain
MVMHEDERDRLARRLRELLIEARKAKGLNQTELAAALKRAQTFVSNYERGERRLGVVDFVLIARVLGEEPMELLKRLD